MALLFLVPAGLIFVFALAGYGLGTLGQAGLRSADRGRWLRSGTAVLGAGAVALYTWGLLHVAVAVWDAEDHGAGSSPSPSCRTPGQEERASAVVGYGVDYLPLRFLCETTGGGSYDPESVPGYVNPAALGFALATAVCAGAAALDARRRAGSGP
ncbi:hypothetical protein [Streptomyces sp. I05A-00742]|uniref:hypothetical protein n=1 Tax=Streptomyces sp. I05A-00742 TaxID=2732853 RepID=UPI001487AB7E|nr:hypothetical protein [Streptomyces sp. I05A-00742]